MKKIRRVGLMPVTLFMLMLLLTATAGVFNAGISIAEGTVNDYNGYYNEYTGEVSDSDDHIVTIQKPGGNTSDISVTKAVYPTSAYRGDTVNYTITVTNSGDIDLGSVKISDEMLEINENIGTLAVGEEYVINKTYTIPSDTPYGNLVNTATATDVEEELEKSASATVTVQRRSTGGGGSSTGGSSSYDPIKVTFEKILLNADDEEITNNSTTFTIEISGPNGYSKTKEFSVNNPGKLSGLSPGVYDFEEVEREGYEFVSISHDEASLNYGSNITVTVTNREKTTSGPGEEAGPETRSDEEIILEPEPPQLPRTESEPEPAEKAELPRTGGYEILALGLGALLVGSGFALKKLGRKKDR